jgi:hypothetical protein
MDGEDRKPTLLFFLPLDKYYVSFSVIAFYPSSAALGGSALAIPFEPGVSQLNHVIRHPHSPKRRRYRMLDALFVVMHCN